MQKQDITTEELDAWRVAIYQEICDKCGGRVMKCDCPSDAEIVAIDICLLMVDAGQPWPTDAEYDALIASIDKAYEDGTPYPYAHEETA